MLLQMRTLAALHYNIAPKPWAYAYLYNYGNWPVYALCTNLTIT